MMSTVSIIHDLQLSQSLSRREEIESNTKGKRGRPMKDSRYISIPDMKIIRKD